MAKPIGMRAHSMARGKNNLAFDNLAIINDDSCAQSPTTPTGEDAPRGPHPKGKQWKKYAVDDDEEPSTGRKVAKCCGIIFMMVVLFSLTAGLVIKGKLKHKTMLDYDERVRHLHDNTTALHNTTTVAATPPSPSSSPAAATTTTHRTTTSNHLMRDEVADNNNK